LSRIPFGAILPRNVGGDSLSQDPMLPWALTVAVAYAAGCLNSGYYLVRSRTGLDLRHQGSGTAGATNTGRLLGRSAFAIALTGDLAKGALVVALARWLGGDTHAALAAAAVVTGHIFPAQLAFRGGKGLATSLGAGAVLAPVAALGAVVVAILGLLASRRPVAAALAGVAAAPLVALGLRQPPAVAAGLGAVAVVVLVRHAAPAPWVPGKTNRSRA
jgi:acyl phosphate:glycerol-3-phosphate acyltransferase